MHRQHFGDLRGVSRSRLIVALLAFISALVLILVWQAIDSLRTNRATATKVLQDYARLAGDEYVRQAMAQIGYYGYYTDINALSRIVESAAEGTGDPAGPSALARDRFVIEVASGRMLFTSLTSPELEEHVRRRARELIGLPAPEAGFTIDHKTIEGQPYTILFAATNERDKSFGIVVDRDELSQRLGEIYETGTLLPEILADGAITNEYVFLRFTDHSGELLFQSPNRYDPYLVASRTVGADYGGIFDDHTVATAIDASMADSLVIGGLPRSRLPVLLITVILTIGLLAVAVRQMYREQALMKMRDGFVSEVSHELRTPLTQIRMFTETLLLDRFRNPGDRRRALDIINRESQRLIHLVENVLRFSNRATDARNIDLSRGKLAPAIERVVEEFGPLANAADNTLEIELDASIEVEFDADSLRQILVNLLDNAVKYGPPGQNVSIELVGKDNFAQIRISDQGQGIPAADRDRIWDGYVRLDRDRKSAIAGTGIGLSVVRDLVREHGGTAFVDPNIDTGACFVVQLPLVRDYE